MDMYIIRNGQAHERRSNILPYYLLLTLREISRPWVNPTLEFIIIIALILHLLLHGL